MSDRNCQNWKMEIYSKLKTEDVFSNINIFQITGGGSNDIFALTQLKYENCTTLE